MDKEENDKEEEEEEEKKRIHIGLGCKTVGRSVSNGRTQMQIAAFAERGEND